MFHLLFGDQTTGEEPQNQQQDQSHRQQTHMCNTGQKALFDPPRVRHWVCDKAHKGRAIWLYLNPQEPDQKATQNGAVVVARAPNDHHHPDKEREAKRLVTAWGKLTVKRDHHRPRNAANSRSQNEDLQVPRRDIFAHRARSGFIVTDSAHHAAPWGFQRQLCGKEYHQKDNDKQHRIAELDIKRRGRDRIDVERCCALYELRTFLQLDF